MESISRISSLLESARELTLDASSLTSLRKTSTTTLPISQLKKLLDSRHEREVLDGMRRVIALSQRPNASSTPDLLPAVLKNVSSPNAHIRKLVYIFLVSAAESDPDTALLSINSIQKSLSASDPHMRALALRTISSLRVPVIAQIVSLGIKRGAADMSPIVRRAAVVAIPKCWRLEPTTASQLEGYMDTLLGDKQYFVVGAAVMAFVECCPERLDMIHKHYRSLVRKLVDMDEWSQLATIRLLTTYARKCFPQRSKRVKKIASAGPDATARSANFYQDSDGETNSQQKTKEADAASDMETVDLLDPDLELLLKSAQPLLQSRNAAVVTSLVRLYLALTTPSNSRQPSPYLIGCVGPLIALLRTSPSMKSIALHNVLQIMLLYPSLFLPYTRHFLLHTTDMSSSVGPLKLEALSLLFPHAPQHTQSLILTELTHAAKSPILGIVAPAVAALGRCATSSPPGSATSQRCLRLLLSHISSPTDNTSTVAAEALAQIRHLIQRDPAAHIGTVVRLAKDLDTTVQPHARASIIWLVGEFAGVGMGRDGSHGNIAADVLRILTKGFCDESEEAKRQIVLLAAKVYLHHLNNQTAALDPQQNRPKDEPSETEPAPSKPDPDSPQPPATHPIALLYTHIHSLVRYDTSYSIRDLARTHRALLPLPSAPSWSNDAALPHPPPSTQLATLLLLAPKPPPAQSSPSSARRGLPLGSAALALGERGLADALAIPAWVEVGREPDARLRDEGGFAGYRDVRDAHAGGAHVIRPAADGKDAGSVLDKEKKSGKTLDDWLEESDEEDDEEDEGEETESEDESESEETEEESEEYDESSEDDEDERGKLVR